MVPFSQEWLAEQTEADRQRYLELEKYWASLGIVGDTGIVAQWLVTQSEAEQERCIALEVKYLDPDWFSKERPEVQAENNALCEMIEREMDKQGGSVGISTLYDTEGAVLMSHVIIAEERG